MGSIWLDRFSQGGPSLDPPELDPVVLYVLAAVSAVNLMLVIGLIVLSQVLKADTPGSSMNFYVGFGSLAIVACVVLKGLSAQDIGTAWHLDAICQFYPVVLCMGSVAIIGGLLMRMATLYSFYKTDTPQKVHKHEFKPNIAMLFLLLIEGAALLVLIIFFQLHGTYVADGLEKGVCKTAINMNGEDVYHWFCVAFSAWHALLLLIAAVLAWPAIYYSRRSPSETECNVVAVAIYNALFAIAAGAIVFFVFPDASATMMYAIVHGLMQYIVMATLVLLIGAKVCVGRTMAQDAEDY